LAREDLSESDASYEETDGTGSDIAVNMVFEVPAEFWAPEGEVAELTLEPKTIVFKKPKKLGQHMKPLFVIGYVEGKPL
jgi:hypothetical protein